MKNIESDRLRKLSPYLFAEIDKIKRKKQKEGVDVISLSIGDPDIPTPHNIIRALNKAARNKATHRYPSYEGLSEFRAAVASFYKRRFNVEVDPDKEVFALIGSKEGIAHTGLAFLNRDDYALYPDPAYPVYRTSIILADAKPLVIPLLQKDDFLPNFKKIDKNILKKSKLLFLNYPNNPTAAVCELEFFNQVVEVAKKYNIIICHDAAYTEITFNNYKAPSFLQADGAKEVGVEYFSLSKPYNMTGWRIGAIVGGKKFVELIGKLKTNIDSGVPQMIQYAGIEALNNTPHITEKVCRIYKQRQNIVINTLKKLGFTIEKVPLATFYIWVKVPKRYKTSTEFTTVLLDKTGVLVTPGVGYGKYGEGYFRISLTLPTNRLKEAMNRLIENERLFCNM